MVETKMDKPNSTQVLGPQRIMGIDKPWHPSDTSPEYTYYEILEEDFLGKTPMCQLHGRTHGGKTGDGLEGNRDKTDPEDLGEENATTSV